MKTKIFNGSHTLTSPYGWRTHPVTGKKSTFHNGADFSMVTGTKLLVPDTFNGAKVRRTLTDKYGGKYIQLQRSDGKGCYYLHVSSFKKKVGDTVKTGDVIALSGNTGQSTGAHTHFGVQKKATVWTSHEDPMQYITLPRYESGNKLEQLENMNVRDKDFKVIGSAKKGSVCLVVDYYKEYTGYSFYEVEFADKLCYIADSDFNKETTKTVTNLDGSKPDTCEDEVIRLKAEIERLEAIVQAQAIELKILSTKIEKLEKYEEYYKGLSTYLELKEVE